MGAVNAEARRKAYPPTHLQRKVPGKSSRDMLHRSESALDSIRTPKRPEREEPIPPHRWRIVRGDYVQVIGGRRADLGKRGHILEVVRKSNRVVVEGVNIVRKMVPSPHADSSAAEALQVPMHTEAPVHVSNVAVVCPQTDRPTRIRIRWLEDGTRVRVSQCSGAIIPRPEILLQRRKPRLNGGQALAAWATPPQVARQRTRTEEEMEG